MGHAHINSQFFSRGDFRRILTIWATLLGERGPACRIVWQATWPDSYPEKSGVARSQISKGGSCPIANSYGLNSMMTGRQSLLHRPALNMICRCSVTLPREFWSHVYSWLVQPKQLDSVVGFLERRSLMNRWMPEGASHIDAAYLGELPWAASASDVESGWEPIRAGNDWTPTGLEVLPAWEEYFWEGNVRDCSIEEGVRAWFPAQTLFHAGRPVWKPGTRG